MFGSVTILTYGASKLYDEVKATASFLELLVGHYRGLRIWLRRVLTDNGPRIRRACLPRPPRQPGHWRRSETLTTSQRPMCAAQ